MAVNRENSRVKEGEESQDSRGRVTKGMTTQGQGDGRQA